MSIDEVAACLHLAGCPLTAKQYSALIDKLMGNDRQQAEKQREKLTGLIKSCVVKPKLY